MPVDMLPPAVACSQCAKASMAELEGGMGTTSTPDRRPTALVAARELEAARARLLLLPAQL